MLVAPDGASFLSGGDDRTIRVWDAASVEPTRTIEGRSGSVESIAVVPDGSGFISANDDRTLKDLEIRVNQSLK